MVKNTLLDGHIKCRRRLVGDQQIRTASQADGDQRTLTHTTRELVRILTRTRGGVRQACLIKQAGDTVVHIRAGDMLLGDLPSLVIVHARLDEVIGDTPPSLGARGPLLREELHRVVQLLAAHADAGQRLLGCGEQGGAFLGSDESLIVFAFHVDFVAGKRFRQLGPLLMCDVHMVGDKRFLDLRTDTPHRVEVAHRILRDQAHLAAAQLVIVLAFEPGNLLAFKLDGPADHMAGAGQQSQYSHGGGGLAGAGLANNRHPLAGINVEGCVTHRVDIMPVVVSEINLQMLDFQQRALFALHRLETLCGLGFCIGIGVLSHHMLLVRPCGSSDRARP